MFVTCVGKKRHPTFQLTRWICCSMAFWISTRCCSLTYSVKRKPREFGREGFLFEGECGKSWVGQIGGFIKVHYNPNPCLDGWISWDFWSFFTRKFFGIPFQVSWIHQLVTCASSQVHGVIFWIYNHMWCNLQLFVTKIDKMHWYLTTKFEEAYCFSNADPCGSSTDGAVWIKDCNISDLQMVI